MCLFHPFQRRKLLLIFILLCWIYSALRRILEEAGFICEGFRFRVVPKNVILVHWQSCTCFWWLLCQGWALHTLWCCFPGSSSSIIREHNVQLKSKQCQLPQPGSGARISNYCSCLRICTLLWERGGILSGQISLTVACWMPVQW